MKVTKGRTVLYTLAHQDLDAQHQDNAGKTRPAVIVETFTGDEPYEAVQNSNPVNLIVFMDGLNDGIHGNTLWVTSRLFTEDSTDKGMWSWPKIVPATKAPEPEYRRGIGWAIKQMEDGSLVRRAGWNGKGMFLFLVNGSTFKVNRAPLNGIFPEGTEVNYCPHVDMKTADGKIVPWLASQTDLLAFDWEIEIAIV